MNRLERPFLTVSRTLEPGWIDPARVSVALTAAAPAPLPGPLNAERPWQLMAHYEVRGATANVVLLPFGFRTTVTLADGTVERTDAVQQTGWEVRGLGSRLVRKDLVEHLLGDVELLDAVECHRSRTGAGDCEADARRVPRLLGARRPRGRERHARRASPTRRARSSRSRRAPGGRCGDRQILMLSADYRDGQCLVSLRDVMAGFCWISAAGRT